MQWSSCLLYAVRAPCWAAAASRVVAWGTACPEARSVVARWRYLVGMAIAFEGTVRQVGERLLVELPEEASRELPSRGQVAVDGVIEGHEFSTVVEPDGRKGHWIALDSGMPKGLKPSVGDSISGELTPTKEWPEPDVPKDLGAALADAPDLADTWDDITPMARWEWVRWVGATANPATREKRVGVSIDKLRNGKRRPCCFDLSSCTDPDVAKSGKLIES